MRVLFAGTKERGAACLDAVLADRHELVGLLVPPKADDPWISRMGLRARDLGVPVFSPADPNEPSSVEALKTLGPDVTVLAGYGPIVRSPFIGLAPRGCVNLHAGKLPQYRGSSPLNWALLNGETEFTLSIIQVDSGVDTGGILAERTFPISIDDTIADLHATANREFPELLRSVLRGLGDGTVAPRRQVRSQARYFPLRFPDDGLVLWDQLTALQAHNQIRALTDPYPGAFSYFGDRRVRLVKARLARRRFHGVPGRIYLKHRLGLLVCASDRCLWIQQAVLEDSGQDLAQVADRYDKLATLRDLAVAFLRGNRVHEHRHS